VPAVPAVASRRAGRIQGSGARFAPVLATGRPFAQRSRRSRSAAAALTRAGFKDIYSLHGGIFGWKKDGLPVEK
jgi:hypothetical protein